MSEAVYDVIVVGAGGMGSATAYQLARAGARVLVLEQFRRGHTQGSSHGESRAIRMFYHKDFYIELMKSAYAEWRRLEEAAARRVLYMTGGVIMAPEGHEYTLQRKTLLEEAGIASEWWEPEQLAARYPQFKIDPGTRVLWQEDTGFLLASLCVATHLELALAHGAEIRDEMPVSQINWQGDPLEVVAAGQRFRGHKVIVAAGAWSSRLLRDLGLPLAVTRQQIVHYRPVDPEPFRPGRFPVFADVTWGETLYGFPLFDVPGVKVARDGLGLDVVDPDSCSRTPDQDYIDHLRAFMQERIPGAAGETVEAQVCLYTETPDLDFIIDAHPQCPRLLLAAGFSGHGFKFCALVGRMLKELALDGQSTFDLSPFALGRFES